VSASVHIRLPMPPASSLIGSNVRVTVMHVLWWTDRLRSLTALVIVAGLLSGGAQAFAQQAEPRKPPTTKPRPPAGKPPAQAGKAAAAAPSEVLQPSQIGIPTSAQYAFMVDPQTSTVLLFKDADKPMHPSSMAKMMTIYIVFEELAAGRLKLDTKFSVSEKAWRMSRQGSTMWVGDPGSEVTVEDLIKGMIVLSGNDACIVVAEGIAGTEDSFAERMNKKAKELGMTGTVFKNSSGWPAEGQMTTARDLAVLGWRTIVDFPKYYPYYSIQSWTYSNIKQDNRNLLLRQTPGTDGLKTGHTEDGGFGQTVSAVRDGRRLIVVVNGLAMGKPQHEGGRERARETSRLLEWGFREFRNTSVFRAGDVVAEAPVWLGEQDKVPLVIAQAVQLTLPNGQTFQPRVVARFEGPLPAPIVKGTKLGTAAVSMPDGRTLEYPLEAGADVPRHYLLGWLS
jgi:serine-type D-Ala-D-Ala carboxypeptidase (penicillin-binding protein 5/6)